MATRTLKATSIKNKPLSVNRKEKRVDGIVFYQPTMNSEML